ncbi:MAG: GTP-binding protein [Erysipelotrichaceae bacterium]|nr:GTP-binding protein [Erysipelotrichaceae bacterium]
MINVYVISGFLGAGKTTLIQEILKSGILKKPMLIENEFGEVGVDSAFFDGNLQVREINNGCICCSLKGDFKDALEEIKKYEVTDLIIEPSGVGKLSDILPSILSEKDMRLVSHACVVDVKTAVKYHKNFKEYFDDQVVMANAIVLSHLDAADEETANAALQIVQMLNDEVEVNTKPIREYSGLELMDFLIKNVSPCSECEELDEHGHCPHDHHHDHDHDHEEHEHHHHHDHDEDDHEHEEHDHEEHEHHHEHHHHHHHHHDDDEDEPFDSCAFHTSRIYTRSELEQALAQLDDSVLRAKGYVLSEEGTLYFNCLLHETNIFVGKPQQEGLIVVIGTELDEEHWEKVFLVNE